MSKSAPCKDCDKRYSGCHDSCQTYKGWLKYKRDERAYTNNMKLNALYDAASSTYLSTGRYPMNVPSSRPKSSFGRKK